MVEEGPAVEEEEVREVGRVSGCTEVEAWVGN